MENLEQVLRQHISTWDDIENINKQIIYWWSKKSSITLGDKFEPFYKKITIGRYLN